MLTPDGPVYKSNPFSLRSRPLPHSGTRIKPIVVHPPEGLPKDTSSSTDQNALQPELAAQTTTKSASEEAPLLAPTQGCKDAHACLIEFISARNDGLAIYTRW